MNNLFKQLSGLIATVFAAAVCAGKAAAIAVMGTVGLGFFAERAYMFPVFVGFVCLSLWLLYRSAHARGKLGPFWLALAGGIFASVGMWLGITAIHPFPGSWPLFVGAAAFLAGSAWDFVNFRRAMARGTEVCEAPKPSPEVTTQSVNLGRRTVSGAALSIAAAAAFYAMYKSVDSLAPKAEAGEIACWGINECRGKGACVTAFNGCPGRNDCRARGFLNVPEKDCYARGGVPLKGSPGEPAKG